MRSHEAQDARSLIHSGACLDGEPQETGELSCACPSTPKKAPQRRGSSVLPPQKRYPKKTGRTSGRCPRSPSTCTPARPRRASMACSGDAGFAGRFLLASVFCFFVFCCACVSWCIGPVCLIYIYIYMYICIFVCLFACLLAGFFRLVCFISLVLRFVMHACLLACLRACLLACSPARLSGGWCVCVYAACLFACLFV